MVITISLKECPEFRTLFETTVEEIGAHPDFVSSYRSALLRCPLFKMCLKSSCHVIWSGFGFLSFFQVPVPLWDNELINQLRMVGDRGTNSKNGHAGEDEWPCGAA